MQGGSPCTMARSPPPTPGGTEYVNVVGDEKALHRVNGSEPSTGTGNTFTLDHRPTVASSEPRRRYRGRTVGLHLEGHGSDKVYTARWRDGAWSQVLGAGQPRSGIGASCPSVSVNDRGQAPCGGRALPVRRPCVPSSGPRPCSTSGGARFPPLLIPSATLIGDGQAVVWWAWVPFHPTGLLPRLDPGRLNLPCSAAVASIKGAIHLSR